MLLVTCRIFFVACKVTGNRFFYGSEGAAPQPKSQTRCFYGVMEMILNVAEVKLI